MATDYASMMFSGREEKQKTGTDYASDIVSTPQGNKIESQENNGNYIQQMAGNIPSSAVRFAQSIVEPLMSPIETGKNIYKLAGSAADILIPGEHGNEDVARNVGAYFSERYGGMDKAAESFKNDPVGVLADMSIMLTGGGAALRGGAKGAQVAGATKTANVLSSAGNVAQKAGAVVDPLTNVAVGAGKTYGALSKVVPSISPEGLYMSGMKRGITRAITPDQQLANARTGVMEGIVNLDDLGTKMAVYDKHIGEIVDTAARQGDMIPKSLMVEELEAMKLPDSPYFHHAGREGFIKQIDSQIKKINDLYPDVEIPVDIVQKFKTNMQASANWNKMGASDRQIFRREIERNASRGAKNALAEAYPELAAVNAKDAALHQLEKALETAARLENTNNLISLDMVTKAGLGGGLGAFAGAGGAASGTILGFGLGIMEKPAVKRALAVALGRARSVQYKKGKLNQSKDVVRAGGIAGKEEEE